jgi:hypothetical protein
MKTLFASLFLFSFLENTPFELFFFCFFQKKNKIVVKNKKFEKCESYIFFEFLFMLTITSYVGLLFAALGVTLGLYFGLTKVVKLI